ncbi:DUF5615 family PIN-like protein [Lichenibacterium dinghuense]|uniref:DUF5615 family PIN-like protein n=1 Tax=Lichenibacterium dinghuense TaxID=2895977 RepID=UPI002814D31A|nr:DUF5615 family PIN-like protein [Lichenibacterium sp. 6Y81]
MNALPRRCAASTGPRPSAGRARAFGGARRGPRLADASDDAIWHHAEATGAIIVTKDEDFARWKVLRVGGPRVVWIRLRNTRRRELLDWFDTILPDLVRALERGEDLVEIASGP